MSAWLQQGNYSCFRKAHQASARNHWEEHGQELLQIAWQKKPEALAHLLEFIDPCQLPDGIDLKRDFDGDPVLHRFLKRLEMRWMGGFEDVVKGLCRHGADVNQTNRHGKTPLEWLCESILSQWTTETRYYSSHSRSSSTASELLSKDKYAEQLMSCLLRHGARLPVLRPDQLHVFLEHNYFNVVQTLLKHGMDANALDGKGQSLLVVAVERGNEDMVKRLLALGCTGHLSAPCKKNLASVKDTGGTAESSDESTQTVHHNTGTHAPTTLSHGTTPRSPACYDPSRILEMAAKHSNASILRMLHMHGASIWSDGLRLLQTAAFSLSRAVLLFVIENGEWEAVDVSDALKLQSAVHLFVNFVLRQRSNFCSDAGQKAIKEVLSELQKTTTGNIEALREEHLCGSAKELFLAALAKARPDKSDCLDPVTSSNSHSEGTALREARTAEEYAQLGRSNNQKEEGGLSGKTSKLRGHYIHALLVMLRLQPEHSFSKTFTQLLVSDLTGENFVDEPEQAYQRSAKTGSAPRRQPSLNDISLPLACPVVAAFCQATKHLLSNEKSAVRDTLFSIWPIFYTIALALRARLPSGITCAVPALEWLGLYMSSSKAVYRRTSELDQIAAMSANILAHFSTAREGELLELREVVKVFVRSATPACLKDSNLFDALFQQFPQSSTCKSWRADWSVRMKCLQEGVEDKHLAAVCASLLTEGVPVSHVSECILFELLKKKFFKTAGVLVEHGVADMCVLRNGRSVLWKAVRDGMEEMLKHLLQLCSSHHWKLQQGTARTVAEIDQGSCDVSADRTAPQIDEPLNATAPATAGNVPNKEASLVVGCECALVPRLHLMNDLATEAARQNDRGIIEVLHEYNFAADAPSALFEAAENSDRTVLKQLFRLGKWKASDKRNALLLHSSLQLEEAHSLEKRICRTASSQTSVVCQIMKHLKSATESFEQSLLVVGDVEESKASSDKASRTSTITIAGHCIKEATGADEFQKLLSTTILSDSGTPLRAIYLHALLVMERLRNSRCEEFFCSIRHGLWSAWDSSQSISGALACHDLFLHYIGVTGSSPEVQQGKSRRLYRSRHLFESATSLCLLLQWLLPKLPAGHGITVFPVFQWLHGLMTGCLELRQEELLFIAAKIFGVSESIAKDELQPSVKCFSDLAEEKGKKWNLVSMVLELEAQRFGTDSKDCRYSLGISRRFLSKVGCPVLKKDSVAKADLRWLAVMVSVVCQQGMALPDLQGNLVHSLLTPLFSDLLEALVLHGLDVWVRGQSGTPLVWSALQLDGDSEELLHAVLPGVAMKLPGNDSDGDAESAYVQQLESNGGDELDLWLLVVEQGSIARAQALREHRIPIRRKALLSAAVQADDKMFKLLLDARAWTDLDKRDAFNLRSARCLLDWLIQTATLGKSYNILDYLVRHIDVVELLKMNTDEDCLPILHIRYGVLPLFRKALQFGTPGADSMALPTTDPLLIAGHELHEASTEPELLELAEKLLPTETGTTKLASGAHVHGLLVMQRLVPGHPVCLRYFKELYQHLVREHSTDAAQLRGRLSDEQVVPFVTCFQLIQLLLHTEKALFRKKCEFSESTLCLAITMAIRLVSSNVEIDATPVFKAAAHTLELSTFDKNVNDLMLQVREFLLVMCQHQGLPAAANVVAAVRRMAKTSAQLYGKQTFLHLLVDAWVIGGVPSTRGLCSSGAGHLSVFDAVKYLLTEFLDEKADPNAVDSSDETAAHCVIKSYHSNASLSVEEGVALLELFDDYGIHWDAYFGNRKTLVDLLQEVRDMKPLAFRLKSRPGSLQCLAAHAASGPACSTLPKRMQQFIHIHKPGSALSYADATARQRAVASQRTCGWERRYQDCYEPNYGRDYYSSGEEYSDFLYDDDSDYEGYDDN